jgi:homoserine O-acetyltransferase/O-succinyltransferase
MRFEENDQVFGGFRFGSGETLDVRLHYATAGTQVRDSSGRIVNAVLMLHWTGGTHESLLGEEFRHSLYGPGRPLDAATHYLIFPDSLGHGGSSKPSDGLRARFPRYGYREMVELQHKLVTEVLGIRKLRSIVGISMGGMHAWMWAELWPEAVLGIVPVVAMPMRISGRNLVWRRIVARQIRTDPEWLEGEYLSPPRGFREAYTIFRMMLHGVQQLQDLIPDVAAADAFVEAAAEQGEAIDANDLLYALEASEDYDPVPERILTKVLAVNFADDEFNPVLMVKPLIYRVPHGRLVLLPGGAGHQSHGLASRWAERVRELHDSI